MRLDALAAEEAQLIGDGAVEVTGLAADSRAVRPGDLFAALSGGRTEGGAFAREAVGRGAVAVLGDARLVDAGLAVPLLVAEQPRRALAKLAARLAGIQPATVVAVTGTNGKSSIVTFTRQIWTGLGHCAASLGTLGVASPSGLRPQALTTPDPIELHRTLAGLAGDGVTHTALEASSHALDQGRLDGVVLSAAAFSQLSRDHFDYHGGFEGYFAAKARLFTALLPSGAVAVLNADVPEFARLAAMATARGLVVLDYGRTAARLRLLNQRPTETGQRLEVELDGRAGAFESPLVGEFQAHNLLAAAGLAMATGAAPGDVLSCLPMVEGARGRVELVARLVTGAAIFVDYAHTPDALVRLLQALRPHCAGRLHCVFGAGGDRDPGKRPLMGEAVAAHADLAYVTDDNPRSEDPAAIRAAVLAGCPGGVDAGDRRTAIGLAIKALAAGDVLVVAGKGHEQGQTIAGRTWPFDDAAVVREAVAAQRQVAA